LEILERTEEPCLPKRTVSEIEARMGFQGSFGE
jgi:hypothetical protein